MLQVQATTYRIENFAILIRHVLAQPGVRKVEAGAPWAVGSATRACNFCGVHNVTKVENLWYRVYIFDLFVARRRPRV